MSSFFATYFSSSFLLETVTGTRFESFYLYFSSTLIILSAAAKIYLLIKKGRPDAYEFFDKIWFWGFFSLGLLGLFIWFSRNQMVPFFSIRLVSYMWILAVIFLTGFLVVYYFKILPEKITKFYDRKRKSKYLSK